MSWKTLRSIGFAAIALVGLTGLSPAGAVTRSEAGRDGQVEVGATADPAPTAAPPAISFRTDIKLLPDDGIGLVFQTTRATDGRATRAYSFRLRLGGVDFDFGPGRSAD